MVLNHRNDDEVTSVVDKEVRPANGTGNAGDDVVTFTAVRPDHATPVRPNAPRQPDDLNSPANADQDERVRLMARGSGAALSGARERVLQRRSPARKSITPDDATEADQVLNAQDRDQYAGTDRPVTPPAPADHFPVTPPVPRSEVDARRNALSQTSAGERRFESVPEVKPEVALPRLREFFKPGTTGALAGASSTGAPVSSFDMVVRRAQEIKAEAGVQRDKRTRRQPTPPPAIEPEPEPVVVPEVIGADPADADVVWDVQTDLVQVAFARARNAISLDDRPEEPVAAAGAGANDWPVDAAGPEAESHVPVEAFGEFDHPAAYEADVDDLDLETRYPRESESPRGSWWRSLNFRKKRQPEPEPVYAGYDDPRYDDDLDGRAEDPYDEVEYATGEALGDAGYETGPVAVDGYGMAAYADDPGPLDEYDTAYVAEDEYLDSTGPLTAGYEQFDLQRVTTEESWLEDELAFPEPQPAAWHDERAHLLASRIPLEPLVMPAPDILDAEPEPSLPVDRRPEPVQREPAPYYALDEPGGFNAFRAALFGAGREPDQHDQWAMTPPDDERTHSQIDIGHIDLEPTQPEPRPRPERSTPRPAGRAAHTRRDRAWESRDDIAGAMKDEEEPRRTSAVASGMPKCCATCRSFMPDADGRRGRCTNDWASTHRQMVNAEDLACRSSIGDWWLATDTSWIPPVDRIQPETPRADRLAARHDRDVESADAHRSRVRTRKVV